MGRIVHLPGRRTVKRLMARGLTATTMAAALLGLFAMTADGAATTYRAAQPQGSLASVSCVSTADCMAVGYKSPSTGPATTLVLNWNGTKWSVVPSPNPAGADGTNFVGVACTSAANCLAVGSYFAGSNGGLRVLAARWNGTTWSLVSAPTPAHYRYAFLSRITCTSATNCWAVGGGGKPFTSKVYRTLIEHWNGAAWSIVPSSPVIDSQPAVLADVSCGASRECWAVGYWYPPNGGISSLTERWNGSAWSVVTTPSSRHGMLVADYCASTSACLAVGTKGTSSGARGLPAIAQRWTGTNWVTAPPAQPSSTFNVELAAVACASASACESTGIWWYKPSRATTLGESWNGQKWTMQAMPPVPHANYAYLGGVSCPKSTDCWAVGQAANRFGFRTLLEHWNGKTWSLAAEPVTR